MRRPDAFFESTVIEPGELPPLRGLSVRSAHFLERHRLGNFSTRRLRSNAPEALRRASCPGVPFAFGHCGDSSLNWYDAIIEESHR